MNNRKIILHLTVLVGFLSLVQCQFPGPYCLKPNSGCSFCEVNCITSTRYTNLTGECTLDQQTILNNTIAIDGINVMPNVVFIIREETCQINPLRVVSSYTGNSSFTIKFQNQQIQNQFSNINLTSFLKVDQVPEIKFQNLNISSSYNQQNSLQITNSKKTIFDDCLFNHQYYSMINLQSTEAVVNNFRSQGKGLGFLFLIFSNTNLTINFQNLTLVSDQKLVQVNTQSKLVLSGQSFSIVKGTDRVLEIGYGGQMDILADKISIENYQSLTNSLIYSYSQTKVKVKANTIFQIIQNQGVVFQLINNNTLEIQGETIIIDNNVQYSQQNSSLILINQGSNTLNLNASSQLSMKNNSNKIVLVQYQSQVYFESYNINVQNTNTIFSIIYSSESQTGAIFKIHARNLSQITNSSVFKTEVCGGTFAATATELIFQNLTQTGGYFYQGIKNCQSYKGNNLRVEASYITLRNSNLLYSTSLDSVFDSQKLNILNSFNTFLSYNTIQFNANDSISINTQSQIIPPFVFKSNQNTFSLNSKESIQFQVSSDPIMDIQQNQTTFKATGASITFNQPAKYSICSSCIQSKITFQYYCAYGGTLQSCIQNCLYCIYPYNCEQCKPGYELASDFKRCIFTNSNPKFLINIQDE